MSAVSPSPPLRMHPATRRSGVVLLLAAAPTGGCTTAGEDDVDRPVETDTLPAADDTDRDTDPVEDTDDSDALPSDTDDDARFPALVWNEALQGLCTLSTPCRADWVPSETTSFAYPNALPATAGRGVGSVPAERATVLVDLQRDVRGDGSFGQRGLVLAWDPDVGGLVDAPELPDDFQALGVLDDPARPLRFLALVDVDGDGAVEVLRVTAGDPLLRWSPASGRFLPDARFLRSVPAALRTTAAITYGIFDVDNDGLLDVVAHLNPHTAPGWGPLLTHLQAGAGYWEAASLHPASVADWSGGVSGVGALWPSAGGLPLVLTPGDVSVDQGAGLGSCWAPVLESRIGEGYPMWVPCDLDARNGASGILKYRVPMGVSVGAHDFDRDGAHEVVVTTADWQPSVLTSGEAFLASPRFEDLGGWMLDPLPGACAPDAPVTPDTDGTGWTCTVQDTLHRLLPWGTEGVDLDLDGWRDLVVANGEDADARADCAERSDTCVRRSQVGIWWNLGADPTAWVPTVGVPRLAWWPLGARGGDAPPVGNFNGMRVFDLDDDHDVDFLFSGAFGDLPAVFVDVTERAHRGFCLRGQGTVSNPLAIGSLVEVHTDDGAVQHFQIGGSSGPNAWAHPDLCVGVGTHTSATVVWRWPSGLVQTFTGVPALPSGVPATHTFVEPRWLTVARADGSVSDRRELPGTPLTVTICSTDTAPLPWGETPGVVAAGHGAALSLKHWRGGEATVTPVEDPEPGCSRWAFDATKYGVTELVVTLGGSVMPIKPRVWWLPEN